MDDVQPSWNAPPLDAQRALGGCKVVGHATLTKPPESLGRLEGQLARLSEREGSQVCGQARELVGLLSEARCSR